MTSAKFRLWAGSLTLAAISCFAVVVGVRAEVLPGVSADPQSGAERGPIITDGGSQSVWRQGNTDRGSGAMIVYKNTNPPQSLVLSAGHWYLDPMIEGNHVVWMQTNAACPGAGEGEICTPQGAVWQLVAYSLASRNEKIIADNLPVTLVPHLASGIVTWKAPSALGGPMVTWEYMFGSSDSMPFVQGQATSTPPAPIPPASTTSTVVLQPAVAGGVDSDGDGIPDQSEVTLFRTNPFARDTDGDGLDDYRELYLYHTDATKFDTDGDGLGDGREVQNNTNPFVAGTGFLSNTWYEWTASPIPPALLPPASTTSTVVLPPAVAGGVDTDGDGIPDQSEVTLFRTNPRAMDSDGDGLSDYRELYLYHTDATKFDTDGDGLGDGREVQNNTNPFVSGTDFFSNTWYEWTAIPR